MKRGITGTATNAEYGAIYKTITGTRRSTPLNETKNYFDRRKVYENGELWLAHPDVEGRPDVR